MEEATLRSAYHGAALVYARSQAVAYLQKPEAAAFAHVTTFTTDGTNLNFFAHYASPAEDGTVKYHQYPLASFNVKDTFEGYKHGWQAMKNHQEYAKHQSETLRNHLRTHWENHVIRPPADN